MSTIVNILWILFLLSAIMTFLSFSPEDDTHFWIYWATITTIFGLSYLVAKMFSSDLQFVYDPSAENWRRKTDPLN